MNALSASLKPVASALALFSIVISVYAILGERLFRGPHGLEYYGTFSLSFVTLIGVATGDSWTAEIHKMYPAENSWMAVTAFHLSFSIAVGILAMNVIVSVLVDAAWADRAWSRMSVSPKKSCRSIVCRRSDTRRVNSFKEMQSSILAATYSACHIRSCCNQFLP